MSHKRLRGGIGGPEAFGRVIGGSLFAATALALFACTGGGVPSSTQNVAASATATTTISSLPSSAVDSATPRPSQHHIVAISAGHGGPNNVGAVHHDRQGNVDLVEKDLNLDIARRLDVLLRADGFETVLIRDCDCSVSPWLVLITSSPLAPNAPQLRNRRRL
jgi:N-acetylmuramoyl-L-alanine amidase